MTPAGVRVALVTGANRGLGFETSRQLLAKGLRVALAGRDDQALARAVDELVADADCAMTVRMDVTDATSIGDGLPPGPRATSSRPETDDLVASTI